jgi:hypothetical protein
MRIPLSLFACFLLSVSSARPNSYAAGPPLDKIPSPDDLFAFASDPAVPIHRQDPPLDPCRALTQEDFLRFLKDGVIESDPAATDNAFDGSWCTGYFFTKDGTPYHWTLWSRHLLAISTDDRGCLIRLKDAEVKSVPATVDSEIVSPITKTPDENDLFAFTSNLRPGTGIGFDLPEKDLRHFLRDGKRVTPHTYAELRDIADRQHISFSPETAKRLGESIKPLHGTYNFQDFDFHCEGVLVMRDHHIYFWELLGDTALELTSPTGEKCVLLLPENSPIEGP